MHLLSDLCYPNRSLSKDGLVAGGQNTDSSLPEAERGLDAERGSLVQEAALRPLIVQPNCAAVKYHLPVSTV